jgi:hypothetical protein
LVVRRWSEAAFLAVRLDREALAKAIEDEAHDKDGTKRSENPVGHDAVLGLFRGARATVVPAIQSPQTLLRFKMQVVGGKTRRRHLRLKGVGAAIQKEWPPPSVDPLSPEFPSDPVKLGPKLLLFRSGLTFVP